MTWDREVVITGLGVVSPIGIGKERFWDSLAEGRSGVRRLPVFEQCGQVPIGADVADFEPKEYVRPRKSLKVMSHEIQIGFAAADLAWMDAGLRQQPPDPERAGIVFGADLIPGELSELEPVYRGCLADGQFDFARWGTRAMSDLFPLWMLKYLPNMPACHIGIAQDIRGPTNSLVLGEVSSLSAVAEAVRTIQRGQADTMLAGGVGSRVHPMVWSHDQTRQYSQRGDDPAAACRPFDAARDGMVNGEGAAAVVLESRQQAQARNAPILARVLSFASRFEPRPHRAPLQGTALRAAIRQVLSDAGLTPDDVGHVNANGLGTTHDDAMEAHAIRDTLGDVPVTAIKSYFGNLGASGKVVEMLASIMAFQHGAIPPTLNYCTPAPDCPIEVIHGGPRAVEKPIALVLNSAPQGQAVAMLIAAG